MDTMSNKVNFSRFFTPRTIIFLTSLPFPSPKIIGCLNTSNEQQSSNIPLSLPACTKAVSEYRFS